MSTIRLLPEDVASQVAAGEVIERPASAAKELVENSIDAGASHIDITASRGGKSLLRVTDDGSGMDRDDALLCLERHATSKIRTGHDLARISTLGFRGEALPSIASVSRFRLATRRHDAPAGTEVTVSGGRLEQVRDSGEAPGTSVEVRSLFYNLPARRKFLRSDQTETNHLQHQVHLQALGHPRIGFRLTLDGRLAHALPPASCLLDRIRDLYGSPFANDLLELPNPPPGGISVTGFIGKPGVSRSTRDQQFLFLNGRPVDNPTVSHALREGYHTALMKGRFPITFLFIDLDPALVDVNVHPAKREVRFRDPDSIRDAITRAVRSALAQGRDAWRHQLQPGFGNLDPPPPREDTGRVPPPDPQPELLDPASQHALRADWWYPAPVGHHPLPPPADREVPAPPRMPDVTQTFTHPGAQPAPPAPNAPPAPHGGHPAPARDPFRILGVLGRLYIVMENASGLVLVDQHAAHERILFETLRRRIESGGIPTQQLLIPIVVDTPPRDADWLSQNLDTLRRMGIGIEPFGNGTFKIDALPQFIQSGDSRQLLRDLIDDLRQTSLQSSKARLGEDTIATTVCRHAVKARDPLSEPELHQLLVDLMACDLPYCCPHGRPTMIQISYPELERKFGRRTP